ncbi:phosphate ABC transporter permease subunit PstC [bacterium]|nr:phosphate ABC transporter permease subunit PstC [bacterium]
MNRKKIQEILVKNILLVAALSTSLAIGLIVFFLFQQGLGIFNEYPLESESVIVVNENVSVKELSAFEIKEINDKIKTNWNEFEGGTNEPIRFFTDDKIGDDEMLMDVLRENPYSIASVDADEWKEGDKTGLREIPVPKNSLTSLLTGKFWFPTAEPVMQLGILPLLLASFLITFGAILFATPIGVAIAVYLSEVANPKISKLLKPLFEILAGIPSVVFGFFGLVVVVPFVQKLFELPVGETALVGILILSVVSLPTIISVSEDALSSVPHSYREASLSLGATKWETIYRVVVPSAFSGITTGVVLGIGRVIGETMIVLMVTGNAAVIPEGVLHPVRTLTATIAAELGEAPFGGVHFQALFFIGCVLFLITLVINLIADYLISKHTQR